MEIDSDKLINDSLREGIRDSVSKRFSQGYNNPIDKLLDQALADNDGSIRGMLSDAIRSCVEDADFRDEINDAVRHTLAKTLVKRFGGELEKRVNELKSDPTTRARITLAIEEIVASRSQ